MPLPKLSVSDPVVPTAVRDLPAPPPTVGIWVSEEARRTIVRMALPLLALIPAATLLMIAAAVTR